MIKVKKTPKKKVQKKAGGALCGTTNKSRATIKKKPKTPTPTKHPGGRPPAYKTLRELQEKIEEYFDSCWIDKVVEVTDKEGNVTATNSRYQDRPYTVMGLILALGFNSRQSFSNYKNKPEFMDAIKKARSKIEMNIEEYLIGGKNAAGPIFWLKNNAEEKYRDKQEHEFDMKQPLSITIKKFYRNKNGNRATS